MTKYPDPANATRLRVAHEAADLLRAVTRKAAALSDRRVCQRHTLVLALKHYDDLLSNQIAVHGLGSGPEVDAINEVVDDPNDPK